MTHFHWIQKMTFIHPHLREVIVFSIHELDKVQFHYGKENNETIRTLPTITSIRKEPLCACALGGKSPAAYQKTAVLLWLSCWYSAFNAKKKNLLCNTSVYMLPPIGVCAYVCAYSNLYHGTPQHFVSFSWHITKLPVRNWTQIFIYMYNFIFLKSHDINIVRHIQKKMQHLSLF